MKKKEGIEDIYLYLRAVILAYGSENNLYFAFVKCVKILRNNKRQNNNLITVIEAAGNMLRSGDGLDVENPAGGAFNLIEEFILSDKKLRGGIDIVKRVHLELERMEGLGRTDERVINGLLGEVSTYISDGVSKNKRKLWGGMMMTTVAACMVAVAVQGMVYMDKLKEQKLRTAISQAMTTSVSEVFVEKGRFEEKDKNHNTLLAVFLQSMLKRVDDDIDLTIRVCDENSDANELEVEAVGEYLSPFNTRRRVTVRRRIAF